VYHYHIVYMYLHRANTCRLQGNKHRQEAVANTYRLWGSKHRQCNGNGRQWQMQWQMQWQTVTNVPTDYYYPIYWI